MPELPEIASRAAEMDTALAGKTIQGIEVLQPKCLNVEAGDFISDLTGAEIKGVGFRGKWLLVDTTRGWLLLNLGMGGEILLVTRQNLPEKHKLVFDFTDGTCLSVNFWWFGYAHYAAPGALESHPMVSKVGKNALDFTTDDFKALFEKRRTRLKMVLLDQAEIAGIGNAYIHDILFLAKLHPLRVVSSLSDSEIAALVEGIQNGLRPSLEKGGAFYEVSIFGQKGGFTFDEVKIGYREGQPCPACGATIVKIKTSSTSSFICPECQPENGAI